jgi:hypothetical protein
MPALVRGREARISKLVHTTSPPCSRSVFSVASVVSGNVLSVALELDSRLCSYVIVGQATFHLADNRNEIASQSDDYSEDACEHE